MDRQIVYPGGIPLDTDLLNIQRNTLVALGYLAQATLGSNVVADGLACTPTQPASLAVVVGPGSITQMMVVDGTAFGSLPAITAPLLKMGVNAGPVQFSVVAPTTPGQSINYLIQGNLLEADGGAQVLPYYNASNPQIPYSGQGNTGAAQNTQRTEQVQLQIKAGTPGAAGSQATPTVDAGWSGLYVVTVSYGQTAVAAANIARLPTAPFLSFKLPNLSPGYRNLALYIPANQGNWTVPAGISLVKLRIWGGGGGGGGGFGGAGGGGSGGGYSEGYYAVSPGQTFFVTVGNGGVGPGSPGGSSSFGALASATGGQPGNPGAAGVGGAGATIAGQGYGSGLVVGGSQGSTAFAAGSLWVGGQGGGSFCCMGATTQVGSASGAGVAGHNGGAPGAGGGGGIGLGAGGIGSAGVVMVEW